MTPLEALAAVREADAALRAAGPRPFPLPIGGLAPAVAGALTALGRGDWWVPGLRERAGGALRGAPTERLLDPRDGARPYKIAPADGSPGLRALVAVGLAAAEPEKAALVHLGVGSAADGAWHEALNLAALLRPNVVFLVAVHPLDGDAPLGPQLAADPCALARAFGLPAVEVDGDDPAAVSAAVAAAKAAGGPHLVHARLAPAQEASK